MSTLTLAQELKWLQDNPQFEERPASIIQFLGSNYLNVETGIRKRIKEVLQEMIGDDVDPTRMTKHQLAMVTGAIGIGKTTIASVVLPYLVHWCLCLKDPQAFFELLPGSRIAFMQMSTSGDQAKEVIFTDIKARIEHSPWFKNKYPFDPNFKNQLRFGQKDIWILPGDSAETTFEGYNILGGILDEADSHKVTKNRDYAEQGYRTIFTRMSSRYQDRGFLLVIGAMKKGNGFAARKFSELKRNSKAYTCSMTIWESFGWNRYLKPDGTRDSFWYDTQRHEVVPPDVVKLLGDKSKVIEIPNVYRQDFENNPELALRDLAGMPPAVGSPFISLTYKITDARDAWMARYKVEGPVDTKTNRIESWFKARESLKRVCHIDMAYSSEGDALGFAMAHVPEMVEREGETKPYIVVDLIFRLHAPPGREIFIGDVRRMIYDLRDNRGFRIVTVTMDGFQSTDTKQQLIRRRINAEIVSVDKSLIPYYDLREALYEDRIAFPQYMVRLRDGDAEYTEILVKELTELVDNGDKIDHPEEGSKDIADAVAGCVFTLMGDRSYHRKHQNMTGTVSQQQANSDTPPGPWNHPAVIGGGGFSSFPQMVEPTLWRPRGR